jgi:hypothetical protein
MTKKRLIPFIAITLFSVSFTGADLNDASRDQEIRSEVNNSTELVMVSDKLNSEGNVTSDNQTFTLKNPSFQEMKNFILKDPASRKQFVLNKYECRHFATEVVNNAEVAGLRAGFALLGYERGQHAVVAFETIDRGLIFIEPQTDVAIDVRVGGIYEAQEIKEILIAW